MNLPIAKRTESKEAKAHAFSWRKQKTYVFDGGNVGVWGFMGAVYVSGHKFVQFGQSGYFLAKHYFTHRRLLVFF
jgi:hypothetical protein